MLRLRPLGSGSGEPGSSARWNLSDRLAFFSHIESAEVTGCPCGIIDLNSGLGAKDMPVYAVYSASKAALSRIDDSVVHFGRDQGVRVFEVVPGVVKTEMTKPMPVHHFRTEGDWTSPEQVPDLASGTLTGRFVRAGTEFEASSMLSPARI